MSEYGLCNPAERKRRHGDAQLRRGDVGIQVVEKIKQPLCFGVAGSGESLYTRAADTDEGKLRGYKESICEHKNKNSDYIKECYHGGNIVA
jgi:hypothetical protein